MVEQDEHVTAPDRHERPEDWGWHAELGRLSRIAGWLSVLVLLGMNFTPHYNKSQDVWIYGLTIIIVLMLVRDYVRRKNAWRS